jgi:hypothetical protein
MKYAVLTTGLLLLTIWPAAAQDIPRVETFFGYSFVRFNASGQAQSFNSNGGTFQLVYNFKPWFGFVGDFGGYHNGRVDNTVANFQFGPRFTIHKREKVSFYGQSLFGGAWTSSAPIQAPDLLVAELARLNGAESGFAMLLGGGMDIKLGHHVALRPLEVNYFLTRLRNQLFDTADNQHNLRASAGVNFMFGGEKPTPPPQPQAMKTCPDGSKVLASAPCPKQNLTAGLTATSSEICAGEMVRLTPTLSANQGVALQWTVNGQPVSAGPQFDFGSSGLAPGTYRIAVTAAGAAFNPSTAEVTIAVKEYLPPTGTVQANPAEVYVGEKSALTSNFTGQCGGPIRPAVYTATEGGVRDNEFDSTGVQFDASVRGEQRKVVTIAAAASDDKSTGNATTTVTVIQKATIGAVRLPDILFPAGSARVNNCGKRVLLEQLRSYFERDPGGKAVLVGHNAENETMPKLAEERALNAAATITAGTGICLSVAADQVLVSAPGAAQNGVDFQPNFCGPSAGVTERPGQMVSANDRMAEYRRVEVWFVPTGGEMPASVTNAQTAGALPVSTLGCPK